VIYELSLLLPVVIAYRLSSKERVHKEELDNRLGKIEQKLKSIVGVKIPLRGYERVPFFLEYFDVEGGIIRPKVNRERLEKIIKWHIESLGYVDRSAVKVLEAVMQFEEARP